MSVKLDKKLNKDQIYLLACSFGPDSMCLFDLLLKEKIKFVVCHVNYHKRAISNLEEKYLRELCKIKNIEICVLDTSNIPHEGNFQEWAREVRYSFFNECGKKYNTSSLLVAHQQDDLFETYLMQKERNGFVNFYGLNEVSYIRGMNVIRPLLNYTKKELQDYDDLNNVPYSLDISNSSDDYRRNYIRHHDIVNLSKDDRKKLLDEIESLNKNIFKEKQKIEPLLKDKYLYVEDLKKLSILDFQTCLYCYLSKQNLDISLSKAFVSELYKALFSNKSNISVHLKDDIYYFQEYGKILIKNRYKKYSYIIEKKGKYEFDEFDIDFTNGGEDRNIHDSDYPLVIEPANKDDEYQINDYIVKVRRLFIDFKMPNHLREVWPVIKNKSGKIIYIPRYRDEYIDNHKSIFKIKLF